MSRVVRFVARAAILLAAPVAAACLDPLVDDDTAGPGLLLPAGSPVPDGHEDPAVDRRIDSNDEVDDEVPLVHGFAGGEAIRYWDFGPAPDFAAPLFLLARITDGGDIQPLDHPTVIDSIPGQNGYSPYWAVLMLEVTDDYDGELVTSFSAVQEAVDLGLVEAPVQLDLVVNCPVVARGVTLQVEDDGETLPAPSRFFWRGNTIDYFDFGQLAVEAGAEMPAMPRYQIRREGGEPLSELVRGVDITGDGDLNDTNDVFAAGPDQEGYSPRCQTVDVAVVTATEAIDTFADESMSAVRAATDLFDPEPVAATVVSFAETDEVHNCPQQREPGGL
jgi:hypothetical protein